MNKNAEQLHYIEAGKGYPVVLLHGYLESTFIWKNISIILKKNFRVICIDLPGHGKSARLHTEPSIDKMAGAVYSLLTSLSITEAVIIGHSMGGYVGLSLLDNHPKAIHSLVLLHSKASADSFEAKKKRELGIEMLKSHPQFYIKESIQNLFWSQTKDPFKSYKIDLIDKALKTDPKGYMDALLAMKKRPDRTRLLQPGNSIIYISGKNDPVIPIEHSLQEMHKLQENSRVILENSGHMGFIEEEKKCGQIILQCVQNLLKHH